MAQDHFQNPPYQQKCCGRSQQFPSQKVRKKIDNIDNKIIELIGDRFKEIHKVTKLKENREEIIDHERITHILKSVQSKAKKNKIDAEIIVRIWQIFIQEAIKLESAKIKK